MNLSSLKQHGLAFVIFIALTFMLTYPLLQGKVLSSHDNLSWRYMSQEGKAWYEAKGGPVYWSNSMFGGMPTYLHFSGEGYGNYLGNYIFETLNFLPRPLGMMLLCFICFYALACALQLHFITRIIGAFAFTFSSYNPQIMTVGHDTKVMTIAFAALVLSGIFYSLNNRKWLGVSIFTIGMVGILTTAHWQIIYYLLLLLGFMGIVLVGMAIKNKTLPDLLKKLPLLVLGAGLALLPGISSTMLTQDYSKQTIRGGQSELSSRKGDSKPQGGLDKDYAFSWSNGVGETFCLLIPRLYGGGSQEKFTNGETYKLVEARAGEEQALNFTENLPLYWGPQPFVAGPIYFGAVIVFLFILSMFVIRSPHKWWVAASCLLFIMLSMGKNFSSFNYFIFDHLPMYNKFRTPSMALSLPMFLFPIMGMWALNEIFTGKITKEDSLKYLKFATIITGGLAVVVGIFSGLFFDFKGAGDAELLKQLGGEQAKDILDAIVQDRGSAAMQDGIRSTFLILASAALIWLFIKDKIKANLAMILIGVLCFFDLFLVAQNYMGVKSFEDKDEAEQVFTPRPVDQQILQDKDLMYRVQDFTINTYNDAKPSYFHKMVGGYHPAKLEMYQDLIEMQMSPGSPHNNKEVYNMLNTKYYIVPAGQQGQAQVIPNTEACGNAWFVNEIKMVATADEEMAALNAPNLFDTTQVIGNFNPRTTAIVRNTQKEMLGNTQFVKDSNANIKLTDYGINNLNYESNSTQAGFAVFSDIYYKDWTAKIDGKETPIVRTNYVLRGLNIPAGKHKIEFSIYPSILKKGTPISIAGNILVLLMIGFGFYKSRKENTERNSAS